MNDEGAMPIWGQPGSGACWASARSSLQPRWPTLSGCPSTSEKSGMPTEASNCPDVSKTAFLRRPRIPQTGNGLEHLPAACAGYRATSPLAVLTAMRAAVFRG